MNELMDKLSQKMLPFAEALSKNRYLGSNS